MSHWKNFKRSLAAFGNSFAVDMKAQGLTVEMDIFNFEAHATVEEMPEVDLIGPMEIGVEEDEGRFYISCMLGVSTFNDQNLFRLDDLIDNLFDRLRPDSLVPLYNADTGSQYGVMKVMNGSAILPVARTKIRPIQAVAMTLGTDRLGPL